MLLEINRTTGEYYTLKSTSAATASVLSTKESTKEYFQRVLKYSSRSNGVQDY